MLFPNEYGKTEQEKSKKEDEVRNMNSEQKGSTEEREPVRRRDVNSERERTKETASKRRKREHPRRQRQISQRQKTPSP